MKNASLGRRADATVGQTLLSGRNRPRAGRNARPTLILSALALGLALGLSSGGGGGDGGGVMVPAASGLPEIHLDAAKLTGDAGGAVTVTVDGAPAALSAGTFEGSAALGDLAALVTIEARATGLLGDEVVATVEVSEEP